MNDQDFSNLVNAFSAKSAQLDSVSERIEIIEEALAKMNLKLSDSTAKKVYRARSFSQFGEDHWIKAHITIPREGFFIEVGAADGITNSNTYWLEKMGWQGICFEPDPRNYTICNLYRNKCEPFAVSDKDGETDFSLAAMSPDWSGLDIPVESVKSIKVKTVTLDTYLQSNKIQTVDLVSIDVEGHELAVLKGFSLATYKPHVVLLEFLSPTKDSSEDLITYMTTQKYKLVHRTFANLIFIPEDSTLIGD